MIWWNHLFWNNWFHGQQCSKREVYLIEIISEDENSCFACAAFSHSLFQIIDFCAVACRLILQSFQTLPLAVTKQMHWKHKIVNKRQTGIVFVKLTCQRTTNLSFVKSAPLLLTPLFQYHCFCVIKALHWLTAFTFDQLK